MAEIEVANVEDPATAVAAPRAAVVGVVGANAVVGTLPVVTVVGADVGGTDVGGTVVGVDVGGVDVVGVVVDEVVVDDVVDVGGPPVVVVVGFRPGV